MLVLWARRHQFRLLMAGEKALMCKLQMLSDSECERNKLETVVSKKETHGCEEIDSSMCVSHEIN